MILSKDVVHAPAGKILLNIPSALQEKIITKNGVEILLPAIMGIEDGAAATGTIHSIGPRLEYMGLVPGDTVAISYLLVADTDWTLNAQGVQDEHSKPIFNRLRRFGADTLWEAAPHMILAVKRPDGWTGVGKNILLEELSDEVDHFNYTDSTGQQQKSSLIVPEMMKKTKGLGRGRYAGGDLYDKERFPLELPRGTVLYFKEKHRCEYRFEDGSEFIILPISGIEAYQE